MKTGENSESNAMIAQERYTPTKTAMIRAEIVQKTVTQHLDLLQKAPIRTKLSDPEQVKRTAEDYLNRCRDYSAPPSIEGLCLALGMSRANFYKWLDRHPESEVAEYCDYLRTGINAIRISLGDQGIINPAQLIFLLKNSGSGDPYTDKVELQAPTPESPLANLDEAAARRRILESLPEPDDD